MAKKLYLSAAAHASDNPTACPGDCSENTHCNQYMDLLEARMKALGIQVRRGARTATGTTAQEGVVAVDPRFIPYGTRMFIVTSDGEFIYGLSTAEDCGTGVDGKRVDLYMHSTAECFQFGVQECTIYFLGDANWR